MVLTEENTISSRVAFWWIWLTANSIGLAMGWAFGELLGLQIAQSLGWMYGEVTAFLICEGFIWLVRLGVLSRVRNTKVLSAVEIFVWITAETIGWLAGRLPYNPESLVGITTGSILAYQLGVITWLIIWLIRIQQPMRLATKPTSNRFLKSVLRIFGSLAVFIFMNTGFLLSIITGEGIADHFGLFWGRVVAGLGTGGIVGALTGWAILSLLRSDVWKMDDEI